MGQLTPIQGIMLAIFIVLVVIYVSFSYIIFIEVLDIKRIWIKRVVALFCSISIGLLLAGLVAWLFGFILDKILIILF